MYCSSSKSTIYCDHSIIKHTCIFTSFTFSAGLEHLGLSRCQVHGWQRVLCLGGDQLTTYFLTTMLGPHTEGSPTSPHPLTNEDSGQNADCQGIVTSPPQGEPEYIMRLVEDLRKFADVLLSLKDAFLAAGECFRYGIASTVYLSPLPAVVPWWSFTGQCLYSGSDVVPVKV